MKRRAGFTLIELLVAITMVSLLSLAGLYAMRVGFGALDRTGKQLAFERRVLGTQRVLEQMIANMMPGRVACHGGQIDPAQAQGDVRGTMLFFDGRRDTMRFVSAFSLNEASRGPAQIIELAVTPGRQGQGVRLMVNEHLYWGPLSAGYFCTPEPMPMAGGLFATPFLPVRTGAGSYILADRLSAVEFRYRAVMQDPPYYQWLEEWPVGPVLPEAVRMQTTPLAADDGRPFTLVAPVQMRMDFSGATRYDDSPRPGVRR
jgi:prepilin-type N-terminal cleavage/methylation domain-containing protein